MQGSKETVCSHHSSCTLIGSPLTGTHPICVSSPVAIIFPLSRPMHDPYIDPYIFPLSRPKLAASVYSPLSGRAMDLSTNAPGLQFYSGNNLNGSLASKGAYLYPQHGGFAMESQVLSLSM